MSVRCLDVGRGGDLEKSVPVARTTLPLRSLTFAVLPNCVLFTFGCSNWGRQLRLTHVLGGTFPNRWLVVRGVVSHKEPSPIAFSP